MISITSNDTHLASIAAEWLADDEDRTYDADDLKSIAKLGKLRPGLLITGDRVAPDTAEVLLKEVVAAELANWVPNASQRLIDRAAAALGHRDGPLLDPVLEEDHGPNPGDHALVQDWVCGIFVLRCATCAHLFRVA